MVSPGIDQIIKTHHHLIAGRRLGLISNYAMTDARLVPVIDRFAADPDCKLVRLFGPEHGVWNAAKEGEPVPSVIDPHSGREAISLYGNAKAPTQAQLDDLDALVIDLQDIGSRYYTNPSTLYYAMEAAGLAHIPLIVLDRPNPIGGQRREGMGLVPEFRSFVGLLPVPIRHGLTFGELARLIQIEFFPDAEVHVVPMAGWRRSMLWPDTGLPFVSASPNTSSFSMALLYPGTCLFEGTNVSLGRGTVHPFEWLGAPWADGHKLAEWFNQRDLAGVRARPIYFTPWRPPYSGEVVQGVQLHVTHPQAVDALSAGVTLLQAFQSLYPESFAIGSEDDSGTRRFFDLLAGGPFLRQALESGYMDDYWAQARAFVANFNRGVGAYCIYEEE